MKRIVAALVLLGSLSAAHAELVTVWPPASGGGGGISPTTPITGCTDKQVLFDDAAFVGCDAGNTYNKTTGQLSLTGKTVTTSNPILNLSQTWNAGGVPFTGIFENITDTASAAGSLLMDLQVGSVSKAQIDKTGTFKAIGGFGVTQSGSVITGNRSALMYDSGSGGNVGLTGFLGFGAINTDVGSVDVILRRDAANTPAFRNGTNAQTLRVYSSYTDASNNSYAFIDAGNTANTLTFGSSHLAAGANTLTKLQINIDGTNKLDYGVTTATWTSAVNFAATSLGASFDIDAVRSLGLGGTLFSPTGLLTSPGAGIIQHGFTDAAAPVAQTIQVQSVVAGNANTAGATFTIAGSKSNGSGGGDLVLQTTLSSAASGTQNTLATALTLKGGTQQANFSNSIQLASISSCATPSGANGNFCVIRGSSGAGFCTFEVVTTTNTQIIAANVPGGC